MYLTSALNVGDSLLLDLNHQGIAVIGLNLRNTVVVMCSDVLDSVSSSLTGSWSWDWRYCVDCFLSSIQTVHSQADTQTADGSDHSHRLSVH